MEEERFSGIFEGKKFHVKPHLPRGFISSKVPLVHIPALKRMNKRSHLCSLFCTQKKTNDDFPFCYVSLGDDVSRRKKKNMSVF